MIEGGVPGAFVPGTGPGTVPVTGTGTGPFANGLMVIAGAEDDVPANDDTGGDAEITFPVEGVVDAGNNDSPTDAGKGTVGVATGEGDETVEEGIVEGVGKGAVAVDTTGGVDEDTLAVAEGAGTVEEVDGAVTAVSPTAPS